MQLTGTELSVFSVFNNKTSSSSYILFQKVEDPLFSSSSDDMMIIFADSLTNKLADLHYSAGGNFLLCGG